MSEQQDFTGIKARMKAMWMAADFEQIAQFTRPEAQQFISRLQLPRGASLLDVACGTGNLSIPAAQAGATVEGVDIDSNSLATARTRAEREGLTIRFQEGDAEALPFPDEQFDVVVSMFGAMFAPRPELAASEMARVCRQGGLIAMANWTPDGFVGKTFQLTTSYAPMPPGLYPPVLWGDDRVARQRFGDKASSFETHRRELLFDYPFGPAEAVAFHREYLGPTRAAFARLDEEGQRKLAADMLKLYTDKNEGDDSHTKIKSEYLEVRVIKA